MRAPADELPIRFDAVTLRARDTVILDSVSLALERGGPTVLLGPNGAGKTTVLRLAMGLMGPSSGSVTWGGRKAVPPARRSLVFQRPVMLRRSAAGNLTFALAAAGCPRAERKARAAELLDLVGLAVVGGRPARQLSGGEQQRLALARALAKEPAVLFLDEPAAGLDPAGIKALEDVIREVAARGIKVVMSTHDLGQAHRLASEIVLLHRGRIIERTRASEFFTAPRTEEGRRFLAGELLI
jgi:tungstate transport system ATP-binding protein